MIDEEFEKWITEAKLCKRWDMDAPNIREMALNGVLQPFRNDHTPLIIYDGGIAIELPGGSYATRNGDATANDVADCIYLRSDVEKFEERQKQSQKSQPPNQKKPSSGAGAASREAGEWTLNEASKVLERYGGIAGYKALPHGKKKAVIDEIATAIKAKDIRNVYILLNKWRPNK